MSSTHPMKILFLSDGTSTAKDCAKALASRDVDVLAVVVGPNVAINEAQEIARCFGDGTRIIQTSRPDLDEQISAWAANNEISILLSCLYEYRIRGSLIDAAHLGGINIHPAVLPHNGGFHTSFWGIVDETPLGATIHWMVEELDAGGVIAQKFIDDDGVIGAAEVRSKQLELCSRLFQENIDSILADTAPRPEGRPSTFHGRRDIISATTFNADDTIEFDKLLKLGRGTSIADHGLTVFLRDGRRVRVQIRVSELPPEDEEAR